MRLRDVLGTESISYIQMAVDSIEEAKDSDAPLIDLQLVQDDIMAFKGCVDDYVSDDAARNLIKCGMSLERIDLYARLSYQLGDLRHEVHRLVTRVNRTGAPYSQKQLKAVTDIVYDPDFPQDATYEKCGKLLKHLARIF